MQYCFVNLALYVCCPDNIGYIHGMRINIHWGEFCGPVERTEIKFPLNEQEQKRNYRVYKYKMELRGYLPFALFKNIHTKKWIAGDIIDSSISDQVIFYAKKIIDDFELKNES